MGIWNIISVIINILLAFWGLYLYLENNKFKSFESQKNLKHKMVELDELEQWYEQERHNMVGLDRDLKLIYLDRDFQNKKLKLHAEIKYYEQINNYEWLFGKGKEKPIK